MERPGDGELERLLVQLLRVLAPAAADGTAAVAGAVAAAAGAASETPAVPESPQAPHVAQALTAPEEPKELEEPQAPKAPAVPQAPAQAPPVSQALTAPEEPKELKASQTPGAPLAPQAPPAPQAPAAPAFSVSASEGRALVQLLAARGIAQGELAGLLGLEKSTVSRLAAGLEQKGWISRGRDEENQRYVRLYLTPAGTQVAARLLQTWQSRQSRILASLTDAERAGLAAGLGGLLRGLVAEGILGRVSE